MDPGGNDSQSNSSGFTAEQSGSGNLASGSMGGLGNTFSLFKVGDDNLVSGGSRFWDASGFTIEGDGNSATISQMSDGNSATLNISGNSNSLVISQD